MLSYVIWLSYHFATTSYIIRYDVSFTDTLSWQAGSIDVLSCFISYHENLNISYPLFSITNRVLKAINDMAFSCIYTCTVSAWNLFKMVGILALKQIHCL